MNEQTDPLYFGLDLSGVDTSRPCLPEGLHVLVIKEVDLKDNKAGTGRNFVITFATCVDGPDHTGMKVISAGYPITKYYPMQQSDNPKAPDYRTALAQLQDAVEGTKNGQKRPPFQPFNYIGRRVVAKLKVRKDDEFGDSNDITKLDVFNEG